MLRLQMLPLPTKRGHRILIVDDELMMRELLTTRLALAGYETSQARNGHEALSEIAQRVPDAVVLDINMPGLNGFGVLERLNERGSMDNLRVMVLTARNQGGDVKTALDLGARDFLTKPFSDAQFLSRIARLLRGAGKGDPRAKRTKYL